VQPQQDSLLESEPVCTFLKSLFQADCRHLVWLAGGSARDTLLGRKLRDIDLVAVLPPAVLESLGFSHVAPVTTSPIWFRNFREYGTVEITRLDSPDLLAEDLARRDFTLNAILLSLDGEVIDPLDGRSALSALTLKPCSDGTFTGDPVRIFRAFRFEAEGYCTSAEAEALLRFREWDDALERIPVERFSREMLKALQGDRPGRFFRRMIETGIGGGFLPELFRMAQVPAGPLQHHPEGDLFTHSLQVLERFSAGTGSALGRFCAFFHDIGKLATDPQHYPKHHGHDEAGFNVAEGFCRRLALPADYGRALAWTSRLHGSANRLAELRPATRIRIACQADRGGIGELLPLVSAADKPGSDMSGVWRDLLAVARMNLADLGIDAGRLALIPPAKRAEFLLQRRVEFLKKSGLAAMS
jgi:tRNA nucleotidyltransferase (CCA-adding enzyme)